MSVKFGSSHWLTQELRFETQQLKRWQFSVDQAKNALKINSVFPEMIWFELNPPHLICSVESLTVGV